MSTTMSAVDSQELVPSCSRNSTQHTSRSGASFADSESSFSHRLEDEHSSSRPNKSHHIGGIARHSVGILLLLTTVFLWTASQFFASTLFADSTYSNPYFVTYVNSCFFTPLLLPYFARYLLKSRGAWSIFSQKRQNTFEYTPLADGERNEIRGSDGYNGSTIENGHSDDVSGGDSLKDTRLMGDVDKLPANAKINIRETASLSFEFSFLWFLANYFVGSCLKYTSVASSTILTSTSSIWTLLIGGLTGVEIFTLKKIIGVLASFAGVILTSTVDISGDNDENRGSFPHKSSQQIVIGDTLALLSAVIYGLYTTMMKKKIGDEARVNMVLFFGFVGLFNTAIMLPGFLIMHYTGLEPFALPPTSRVWAIIFFNSASSMIADICWAYAILLTSPLVVTVGLSLTIPLSLVGQIVLNSQQSSGTYWVGATIVFLSFLFINHESKQQDSDT